MAMTFQFLFTFSVFLSSIVFTNGANIQQTFNTNTANTIFVDPSNQTAFSTIQAAIDSVPSTNKQWFTISIKAGVYNEKVKIPQDKQYIYLKGEGMKVTSVVWGDSDSIFGSATFTSLADNTIVTGITFVNSYNYPPNKNGNPVKPAVAAQISGDKSVFDGCGFLGYQDTLLDDHGRHFFNRCIIEGAIDFIFGGGQSIYQKCMISMNIGARNPDLAGFITAQARGDPNQLNGFIFKQCKIGGNGKAYLGRAWKSYARVIFYRCFLSDNIVPQGWDSWFNTDHESDITFAEIRCWGPGSNQTTRVKWEKNLSLEESQSFTNNRYIDDEGWMKSLPIST